jgi:PIN domain nuclease of toxin-antitoxin system
MSRYLLDTAVFIWACFDHPILTPAVRTALRDSNAIKYVSAATGWEIATKNRKGKLPEFNAIISRLEETVADYGYKEMAVTLEHGIVGGSFLSSHGDPFDRILAAQAKVEGLTLITNDKLMKGFGVKLLW